MAKAPKEPKASKPAFPPHLRKPVLLGLGVVLALFGALILWQGWNAMQQDELAPRLQSLRESLGVQIGEQIRAQRGRFDAAMADTYVRADLAAGAMEDAAKRVKEAWPELSTLEFLDPGLGAAYAGGPSAAGFSRLAVLNAAQQGTATVADVVGGAADQLGMATAVRDGEKVLAIAYGSLPLAGIIQSFPMASVPGRGYMELRTSQRNLFETGDAGLKPQVMSGGPIAETSLQIGIAAPTAEAMFAFPPLLQLLLGLGALGGGVGLLLWARRLSSDRMEAPVEATFAQVLEQAAGPAAPKPAKAAAKPVEAARGIAQVERSIFRAYDIRGVIGQTLDEGIARLIGQAVGSLMREKGLKEIVVGRDGRLSGPSLSDALIEGLRLAGRDVIDIGLAPTPLVVFRDVPSGYRQWHRRDRQPQPARLQRLQDRRRGRDPVRAGDPGPVRAHRREPPRRWRWWRLADHLDRGRLRRTRSPATSSWSAS
jgi:phosphomannomutase/phosphoglucomutase